MQQTDRKDSFLNRSVCPICSSDRTKPVEKIDGETIFQIVKCCSCSFVYVANPIADNISKKTDPQVISSQSRHYLIKKFLDCLSKKNGKLKVLEVGSGWGCLASLITEDKRFDYTGYEPNTVRSAYCKERGLNVINDFYSPQKDEIYDVAILDNILEHVHDPVGLLSAVSSVAKGGCIIVIVPNLRDIRRFIPAWRKKHYWQSSHINYFKFRDLEKIFKSLGLEIDTSPVLFMRGKHSFLHLIQSILDKMRLRILGHYVIGKKI